MTKNHYGSKLWLKVMLCLKNLNSCNALGDSLAAEHYTGLKNKYLEAWMNDKQPKPSGWY